MAQLEDDIARVAALRGKPVERYTSGRAHDELAWRQSSQALRDVQALHELFNGVESMRFHELAVLDALPPLSRTWIKEAPLYVNALMFANLLERVGRERPLLEACERAMLQRVRHIARRYPGVGVHPQAGETSHAP